jgi:hypothetical protein
MTPEQCDIVDRQLTDGLIDSPEGQELVSIANRLIDENPDGWVDVCGVRMRIETHIELLVRTLLAGVISRSSSDNSARRRFYLDKPSLS